MTLPLVLDVALKGSVLVALAATGTLLSRRSGAAQRHFVWALALAGLVALPLLSLALPWRLPVMPFLAAAAGTPDTEVSPASISRQWEAAASAAFAAQTDAARAPEAVTSTALKAQRAAEAELEAASALVAAGVQEAAPSSGGLPLMLVLRLLWLAGAALVLGRLLAGLVALRWVLRDARDVSDRDWLEMLASTAERLDLRVPVRLVESPRVATPMAFGLRRPVVALPVGAGDWSMELRESVLLHELAHVRRGDVRSNLVAQAACALYWFHPLVWGAARRLRIEAERACDDLVLAGGADPSDYAGHLLQMAQASARRRAPLLAVPMAQPSAFEGRVLAILDPQLSRHGVTRRAAALGMLAMLLVTIPLAALAPAQDDGSRRERQRVRQERQLEREIARAVQAGVRNTDFEHAVRASLEQSDMARPERELNRALNQSNRQRERLVEREIASQLEREQRDLARLAELEARRAYAELSQSRAQDRGNPAVSLALAAALQDSLVEVRLAAARALGSHGDSVAINALIAALRTDTSKEVRKMAAWALGEIEDERAVQGLAAVLSSEQDREVRNTVAWALGEIESASAVQAVGAALQRERDPEIRRTLVWALGEIESPEGVPFLATVIRDSDAELREKAAWALGEIESPAAIEPLAAMLSAERSTSIREMIIWALGEIEDVRAVPYLVSALRDTSVAIRRKAVWALGEVDGQRSAPAGLIAAVQDEDTETRRLAVHALAEIGDPASVPALSAAMRDADLDVRRGAVHALGEIAGSAAVEALVAALRDADPEIRRLAARALGDR